MCLSETFYLQINTIIISTHESANITCSYSVDPEYDFGWNEKTKKSCEAGAW